MLLPLLFTLLMQAPRFESVSCDPDRRWQFGVGAADLDKGPRWRDTDEAPPLPPRAALRAARGFLGRMKCRQPEAWEVERVSLEPLRGEPDTWVYLVELAEPLRLPANSLVGSVPRRVVRVLVLLDGTVPTPRVVVIAPSPHPPTTASTRMRCAPRSAAAGSRPTSRRHRRMA